MRTRGRFTTHTIARLVDAITDTTARYQQGMMTRVTWDNHVRHLLTLAEDAGIGRQVAARTRTMRENA